MSTNSKGDPPKPRRRLLAGFAGNVLEWFDFAVYGYFAPVIGQAFFPSDDKVASLLAAFAVFASGFLARPIGAVFFGHLGDRYGRPLVLKISVLLMGTATFTMGLLPSYAAIGASAPVLLTLLRLAQGFSVGGEYTGSVIYLVEGAAKGRRGRMSAWANVGTIAGFLLGSALGAAATAYCTHDELAAWGWRIPFLFGIVIAAVAIFFRRNLEQDSPVQDEKTAQWPVLESFRTEWRAMLQIVGIILTANVGFYMMFVYVTTYLSEEAGMAESRALQIDTIAMCALLAVIPAAGWLSDRIGRKPVLLAASIGILALSFPLLEAVRHASTAWTLAGEFGFAVLIGLGFGANGAIIVEIARSRLRCSTISVAYNVCLALFGGTTPLVATWLISQSRDDMTPAYYMMGMALVTTVALFFVRETAWDVLDGAHRTPADPAPGPGA